MTPKDRIANRRILDRHFVFRYGRARLAVSPPDVLVDLPPVDTNLVPRCHIAAFKVGGDYTVPNRAVFNGHNIVARVLLAIGAANADGNRGIFDRNDIICRFFRCPSAKNLSDLAVFQHDMIARRISGNLRPAASHKALGLVTILSFAVPAPSV